MDERHKRIASRAARRFKIEGMTRDDLKQEATLAILEALADGVTEPSHLYNAARQRLSNLARRKCVELLGDTDESILDYAEPHVDVDNEDEFNARIKPFLHLLTSRERQVLTLGFVYGLLDCDIADRLNVKVRTIQHARAMALRKIRENSVNNF